MNEDRRPTAATGPAESTPRVPDRVAKIKADKARARDTAQARQEDAPSKAAPDLREDSD